MAWKEFALGFSPTRLRFDVDDGNAQHTKQALKKHEDEVSAFWSQAPVSTCGQGAYVEIGACYGETAMMNMIIGGFKRAILVEPVNHVHLAKALNATFGEQDDRFEILPVAIAAEPEEFGLSRKNPGGSTALRYLRKKRSRPPEKSVKPAHRTSLPTELLDEPASLAWMDCQGGEEYIFATCQEQLRVMFPLLMCEVHGYLDDAARFLRNVQSVYSRCRLRTKRLPDWGGQRDTSGVSLDEFAGQKWAQFILWGAGS